MCEHRELSVIEQLRVEEIISELSECREDERASRNQIFTILTAIATFLTVIVTVISMAAGGSLRNLPLQMEQLQLVANALSVVLLSTAMPWLANLGFLSTIRHFYIIELEGELSELLRNEKNTIFHWETVSTPLITFNYKHILPGYPMLYNLNMAITFVSILVLAIVYMLFIQLMARTFNIINIFLSVLFWIVFVIVIFTIGVSSIKAEKIYMQIKDSAGTRVKKRKGQECKENKYKDEKSKLAFVRFVLYFFYPRIADIQKNIFIVLGFLLGYIVTWMMDKSEPIGAYAERFIYVWFILDFLVYQARYLWNDIRGVSNDQSHPEKEKRKRLPNEPFGVKTAIVLSLGVIVFRISAAFVLACLYGGEMKNVMIFCILLVIFISILYEYAKHKEYSSAVFGLVSLGYPIRFAFGYWGAFPSFLKEYGNLQYILILILVLLATMKFGTVFVTLTWVLESVHLKQKDVKVHKEHYRILLEQVSYKQIGEKYPLAYKDSIETIWNKSQMISGLFLVLSLCVVWLISRKDIAIHMGITILFGMIFTIETITLGQRKKGKSEILSYLILVITTGIECLIQYNLHVQEEWFILYVTICLLRIGYAIIYIMFRASNYEELMSFGDKIKEGMGRLLLALLPWVFGIETYEMLIKRKNREM